MEHEDGVFDLADMDLEQIDRELDAALEEYEVSARRTDLKACREEIKTILREELANFKRELRAVVKEELRVFERCMHASGERVMAAAAKSAALRTRSYVHGMMAVDEGVEG